MEFFLPQICYLIWSQQFDPLGENYLQKEKKDEENEKKKKKSPREETGNIFIILEFEASFVSLISYNNNNKTVMTNTCEALSV